MANLNGSVLTDPLTPPSPSDPPSPPDSGVQTRSFQEESWLIRAEEFLHRNGLRIGNIASLKRAMTHKSMAEEAGQDYEILECLGDRVHSHCLARMAYEIPGVDENGMSSITTKLCSNAIQSELGIEIGILEILRTQNVSTKYLSKEVADAWEALIGLLSIEVGFEETYQFVKRVFSKRVIELVKAELLDDPIAFELNQKNELERKLLTQLQEIGADAHIRYEYSARSEDPRIHHGADINLNRVSLFASFGEREVLLGTNSGKTRVRAELAVLGLAIRKLFEESEMQRLNLELEADLIRKIKHLDPEARLVYEEITETDPRYEADACAMTLSIFSRGCQIFLSNNKNKSATKATNIVLAHATKRWADGRIRLPSPKKEKDWSSEAYVEEATSSL